MSNEPLSKKPICYKSNRTADDWISKKNHEKYLQYKDYLAKKKHTTRMNLSFDQSVSMKLI